MDNNKIINTISLDETFKDLLDDVNWLSTSTNMSNTLDTITTTPSITTTLGTNGTSGGYLYTTNANISGTWDSWKSNPAMTVEQSGKVELKGDQADIVINGTSLVDSIKRIEERLNILRPNKELEAEWDQLKELGEQYRALEAKLNEQSKMWDTLKKMPPPEAL